MNECMDEFHQWRIKGRGNLPCPLALKFAQFRFLEHIKIDVSANKKASASGELCPRTPGPFL